jgi:2-isopropylmalate synthase
VRTPSIEQKIRILHLISELGIDTADIGLPGAGPHVVKDVERLAKEIVDAKLPVAANCASRTLISDITPIVEVSQRTGLPIETCTFIGSSPIRQYAEDWTIDRLQRLTDEAVSFAVKQGMTVMYVTEDTTRADPDSLRALYSTAIRAGAKRLCIADTVGHATPAGARAVVRFVQSIVDDCGGGVGIDWHGHRDRDLALENSFAASGHGGRRHSHSRRGHRNRRAGWQHTHGLAPGQSRADGETDRGPLKAARLLCGGVRGDRRSDSPELPGRRPRRVSHRHGRPRGCGH